MPNTNPIFCDGNDGCINCRTRRAIESQEIALSAAETAADNETEETTED